MLRVTTRFSGIPGTPYWNNIFFAGSSAGEAAAAHNAVGDFWAAIAGLVTTQLEGQVQSDVDVVNPASGLVTGTFNVPQRTIDFVGGAAQPAMVQGLIRLRTGVFVSGREIRGRIFVPSPTTETNSGGVPSLAYTQALDTAANGLLTAGSGAGGLVVYSRTRLQAAAVSSVSTWTQFASLRSRRD
jgi:hypothetical protein